MLSPATKKKKNDTNLKINRATENRFASRLKCFYSGGTITTVSTESKNIIQTNNRFDSDLAILGLESFVFLQEDQQRGELQGRRDLCAGNTRQSKATGGQQGKDSWQGRWLWPAHLLSSQGGQSSSLEPSVCRKLWPSQRLGHLTSVVIPASNTYTPASRRSRAMEVKNGACGCQDTHTLKQPTLNRGMKRVQSHLVCPYLLLQEESFGATLCHRKMAASLGSPCPALGEIWCPCPHRHFPSSTVLLLHPDTTPAEASFQRGSESGFAPGTAS